MDVDQLLRSIALPEVAVGTDEALASTVRRGRERRRRSSALLGICTVLVAGGLVTGAAILARDGSPEVATGSTDLGADPAGEPHECEADEGAVTDVATEPPEWRPSAAYRPWTDGEGCLLRIDVVAERPGPDHCGWERATVLITGRPLGERYTDAGDDTEYVRDPGGVFGDAALSAGFDPDAELPATAVDSGYRRGQIQLWYDPADPSAIWMVSPDHTERWPAGEPPACM